MAGNAALMDENRLAMFDHRGHMTWLREFGELDSGGRVYSTTIGQNQLIVVTFNVGASLFSFAGSPSLRRPHRQLVDRWRS